MHVPFMQVDAPLRLPLLPSHDDAAKTVPSGYVAQAPLQTPVVPQLDAAIAWHLLAGLALPVGTGVQVPCFPATAHELQLLQLADPQQTPSVQCPLAQVVSALQEARQKVFSYSVTRSWVAGRLRDSRCDSFEIHRVPFDFSAGVQ
ncbi:MAG TPA: hypothetical protein VFG23_03010 [Polyangia bacterium]|jgi:hypothetical protein|nr:hypothetical protein [Polyangia bacterium]